MIKVGYEPAKDLQPITLISLPYESDARFHRRRHGFQSRSVRALGQSGAAGEVAARAEIAQFLQQPDIQQRLNGLGLAITGANTPATTEQFIRREQAQWRAIAQELDLRPE
jgi:hypothetical protein